MTTLASWRRGMARTLVAVSVLVGASALLSACNTTAGAGEDISASGHAVTHAADKVKEGL